MCAVCGCGKKKGQPGFGKGPKAKAKAKGKACTCGTCKDCKAKKNTKKMSPKQKKLDTDKDGKLEGSDFAALRGKKKK
jgi:hypothetical protein